MKVKEHIKGKRFKMFENMIKLTEKNKLFTIASIFPLRTLHTLFWKRNIEIGNQGVDKQRPSIPMALVALFYYLFFEDGIGPVV